MERPCFALLRQGSAELRRAFCFPLRGSQDFVLRSCGLEAGAKQDALMASIKSQTDRSLFASWFNQRRAESGAERPTTPTALQ